MQISVLSAELLTLIPDQLRHRRLSSGAVGRGPRGRYRRAIARFSQFSSVDENIQISKPSKHPLSNLRNEKITSQKKNDTSSFTSRMMAVATSFRQLWYMI
jgi:hypothetical protein